MTTTERVLVGLAPEEAASLGPNTYAVGVVGSCLCWRHIDNDDIVLVDPDAAPVPGCVVDATVTEPNGSQRRVIKVYMADGVSAWLQTEGDLLAGSVSRATRPGQTFTILGVVKYVDHVCTYWKDGAWVHAPRRFPLPPRPPRLPVVGGIELAPFTVPAELGELSGLDVGVLEAEYAALLQAHAAACASPLSDPTHGAQVRAADAAIVVFYTRLVALGTQTVPA